LPPGTTAAADVEAYYAKHLDEALPGLCAEDPGARQKAEQSFQARCWLAARPGAEHERRAVCTAVAKALAGDLAAAARPFLLRQLALAGRDECVAALAANLGHADPLVRDATRRALAANPVPGAGEALRRALEQTTDTDAQAVLLQALLYRQDPADAPTFRSFAHSPSEPLRLLAYEGLALTGGRADVSTLLQARTSGPEATGMRATDASLRLADRLCDLGDRETALTVYREELGAPAPARYAALIGLGRAGAAAEIPVLIEVLGDTDPEARGAARAALARLPADAVVPAVTARLETAAPALRKSLLQALAESRVAGVRPALAAALSDPDEELRLVAIRGLGVLADPQAAPALAHVVASSGGSTLEAARDALALIPGDAVPAALIEAFGQAQPAGRRELLVTLTTRPGPLTLGFLDSVAADDGDARVRQEALRSLARLADEAQVPALLRRLQGARSDAERDEAARALAAAARRAADPERPAALIVAALEGVAVERRGWLLRALGRIGGDNAIRALRGVLDGGDPVLRDAAVRALADWPDAGAGEDLLTLVRTAPEAAHRVLALRGYVRVVREAPELSPAARLAMLKAAMAAAPRAEDRRLVLAGLGEIGEPEALALALEALDQAGVASEAAVAVVGIAERLRWQYPGPCQEALQTVLARAPDATARQRADELLADIGRYEGHLTHWLLAGPYMADKQGRAGLHATVFPPEHSTPTTAVAWTPVRTGEAPGKSWYVPLDELLGGNHRVAYVRTWVRSAAERPLKLEVGSDDGCKIWLNGALLAEADVDRAPAPAQDACDITLRAGWNALLIKVTQAGGGWAVGARFRTAEGKPVEDLVTLASPAAADLVAADLQAQPDSPETAQAAADLVAVGGGTPDQRRRLLTQLAGSTVETVAGSARETLRKLEASEDYLTAWQVAGPYEQPGTEGSALLAVPFAPELAGATDVQWLPAPVSPGPDGVPIVNLGRLIGGSHRVAYLRARVVSTKARPVRLDIGSDDGVSVWLNGQLVHSHNAARPVRPAEDKAEGELREGENTVLVKVAQGAGEWGACLRFRDRDGAHLDGLREVAP
jgi:HEAT repeat protein